jgi:hypothetical protein
MKNEMKGKDTGNEPLNKISEPGWEFIRLISSSALEEIEYSRKDVLQLIENDKELKKEANEIISQLIHMEVIPGEKDERK